MKITSQNRPTVLVIEENSETRQTLRTMLLTSDYRLQEATTAAEGLAQTDLLPPDVIVLGLELPDMNGIEVIRELRFKEHRLPIIALSTDADETHKLDAFDAGADDFVGKPFLAGELLARLKVALRRALPVQSDPRDRIFRSNDIEVDFELRRVRVAGREVHLTPIEYNLLRLLIRHANRVLPHHRLLREVWGKSEKPDPHYLRVYVRQLRRKLENDPSHPRYLHNEPGIGYRFQTG